MEPSSKCPNLPWLVFPIYAGTEQWHMKGVKLLSFLTVSYLWASDFWVPILGNTE